MFQRFKNFRKLRKWYVVKLKLVDARLYFVSIFVGLLTGLVAVPYHYCLYYFFNLRSEFFASRPEWYWHIPLLGDTDIRVLVGDENATYHRRRYSSNTCCH